MDRRQMLTAMGAMPLALSGSQAFAQAQPHLKGKFKQGICSSVFFGRDMSFEDGCKIAAACGAKGYDFVVEPEQFAILKKHGMQLSILAGMYDGKFALRPPKWPPGWNAAGHKEAQGPYLDAVLGSIDAAAANGCPNVLVLPGASDTVTFTEGADNVVEFLNKAKGRAEAKGIVLCMELTNSLGIQSTKGALFDHIAWGVDVCKRVNSKSVRILFDMWQDGMMEGNVSQKIRDNIQWIGHFHTGSIATGLPPGRYELWRNNEIDFHHLAQVIADTGFKGFVSHEWSPSPGSDVREDLSKSIKLMAV